MRLVTLIAQDIRFQWRHGFYQVYAILTLIYGILLFLLPPGQRSIALTLILFTDTSALGFFFVGALIILERNQNISQSLFVTPLRLWEFLWAKQLSFLLLSLAAALPLVLVARSVHQHLLWFSLGLILTCILLTFFGLFFAARARNVNDYFVSALGLGLLINLPLLAYLGLFDTALFRIFPTRATLLLLDSPTGNTNPTELIQSVSLLLLWIVILGSGAAWRIKRALQHPA